MPWVLAEEEATLCVALISAQEKVEKPWGHELIFAKHPKYVAKILYLQKGNRLSLQYHSVKDETIYLLKGKMLLHIADPSKTEACDLVLASKEMVPGESVHIPPRTVHRMTALEDCEVFEVSTPELEDVVRLEDDYGRA